MNLNNNIMKYVSASEDMGAEYLAVYGNKYLGS